MSAPATPSGSRASTEPSSTVPALTGFDPSRWPNMDTAPRDGSIFLARGLNWGIGPGEHYVYAQWADCGFVDANDPATDLTYLIAWLDASAIEAPSGVEPVPVSTEGESAAPAGGDAK